MPESSSGTNAICPECGGVYFKKENWQKLCLKCYLRKKGKTTPTATAPVPEPLIPVDMLRRLIQLCHPDKHRNSEAATTATVWLLNQRAHG
jgi:hypothetical protein